MAFQVSGILDRSGSTLLLVERLTTDTIGRPPEDLWLVEKFSSQLHCIFSGLDTSSIAGLMVAVLSD
jgi:hypothetical protein